MEDPWGLDYDETGEDGKGKEKEAVGSKVDPDPLFFSGEVAFLCSPSNCKALEAHPFLTQLVISCSEYMTFIDELEYSSFRATGLVQVCMLRLMD